MNVATACHSASDADPVAYPAQVARNRLAADQVIRSIAEQKAALAILFSWFDQAGWVALVGLLSVRVRNEPQLMPMLRALLRKRPGDMEDHTSRRVASTSDSMSAV